MSDSLDLRRLPLEEHPEVKALAALAKAGTLTPADVTRGSEVFVIGCMHDLSDGLRALSEPIEDWGTPAVLFYGRGHHGKGWYWWCEEYPEEGASGPYRLRRTAEKDIRKQLCYVASTEIDTLGTRNRVRRSA